MATTTASHPSAVFNRALKPLSAMATAGLLAAVGLAVTLKFPETELLTALVFLAVLGVAAWMFLSQRYEWTLAVLILYLGLADGFLKLSTGSPRATLVRDVLLYAIVAGALARIAAKRQQVALPPLSGWVLAWLLVVGVQIFNPENGTLGHSIAAVRPHIEWVPLFFFGYYVMQSQARLRGFLLLLLLAAACNGVVGLIQLNLEPDQLAGWGPGYEQALSDEGNVSKRTFADDEGNERTRPFALGGDFGFGGTIGIVALPAALALLALARRRRVRFLTLALAAGPVLGIATSQARTAVIGGVIAVFAYAGLTITSRGGLRTLAGIAVALVIGYGTISLLSSGSEEGTFDRYQSINSPGKALSTAFNYRKDTLSKVPDYIRDIPLGAGIGSKGPAASVAGGGTGAKYDGESEPTFLLIELGIPGLLVMLGFMLALFSLSIKRIRKIEDRETRILLTAVAAPLFAIFSTWFVGVTTATTPNAPYLWFAAGILSYWLIGRVGEPAPVPREPALGDRESPPLLVR
jgi:hypothetical protein